MLEKGKFLEKSRYIFFFVFIFINENLFAETIKQNLTKYNKSLINTSAIFIQNDMQSIQEGKIYFGMDRIKINYTKPELLTIILSKRKGMYTNHTLKETQYFKTENSYIKIFFNILNANNFSEIPILKENSIEINDSFVLKQNHYKIKIIYENKPILLRKIVIFENNQKTEMSFFDHNSIEILNKNFFSMVNPYLLYNSK